MIKLEQIILHIRRQDVFERLLIVHQNQKKEKQNNKKSTTINKKSGLQKYTITNNK